MNSWWVGVRQSFINKSSFFSSRALGKKREFDLHSIDPRNNLVSPEGYKPVLTCGSTQGAQPGTKSAVCQVKQSDLRDLSTTETLGKDSVDVTIRTRWKERKARKERRKRTKKLLEPNRRESPPVSKERIPVEVEEQYLAADTYSSAIDHSTNIFFSPFQAVIHSGDEEALNKPGEILDKNSLKVFVGTWNMCGKPAPKTLYPFIETPKRTPTSATPYLSKNPTHPYHILVIGTQECQRPISESVLFPSKEEWESQLVELLGTQYVLVKTETMAALHLAVFVWQECKHWIKAKDSAQVATGIGGVIANKGGVGISLLFGTTSFLFVNSHFSAHEHKVAERNYDYQRIEKELKLSGYDSTKEKAALTSDRFDLTFWLGDLNYRVMEKRAVIDTKLREGDMKYLHAREQLNIERRNGNVFYRFEEGPVNFPPTYKFDVIPHNSTSSSSSDSGGLVSGTDVYDSSGKGRIPSWTDRILYKSQSRKVRVYQYDAIMDMRGSDHRPVVGVYSVDFDWKKELFLELQSSFDRRTIVETIEHQRDLVKQCSHWDTL